VLSVGQSGWWDQPVGRRLLGEIRQRAVRNAYVASSTGAATSRGLVDDVLLAAWMVLRRHGAKVLAAARPWAYLMSSAQRQVLDEVRAQQRSPAPPRSVAASREILPSIVRPGRRR
jgi:DNA-directed RNA polymerase specialized sigma24 family protein